MNDFQAAQRYFNNNPKAMTTLKRLLKWNEEKTTKENASSLEITLSTAREFKKRFKLKSNETTPLRVPLSSKSDRGKIKHIENPFRKRGDSESKGVLSHP